MIPFSEKIVRIYLVQDCGTGDKVPSRWLQAVIDLGDRAVPLLLQALRQGPPAQDIETSQRDAKADFARLKDFIRQGGLRDVKNKDVVEGAEKLDEASYVRMRVRGFSVGYRERALNALVRFGQPEVLSGLEEVAKQKDLPDELKEPIAAAIEKLRKAIARISAVEPISFCGILRLWITDQISERNSV